MNTKRVLLFSLVILSITGQALHAAPNHSASLTIDDATVSAIQKETGLEEIKTTNNRPRNFALIGSVLAIGIHVLLQKTCPGLQIKFKIKDSLAIGSLGSLTGYFTGKAVNKIENELEKFENIDEVK